MKEKLPLRKCKQRHRQFQPGTKLNVFCTQRCTNIFNGWQGTSYSVRLDKKTHIDLRRIDR